MYPIPKKKFRMAATNGLLPGTGFEAVVPELCVLHAGAGADCRAPSSLLPQFLQKVAPSAFSAPHFVQNMDLECLSNYKSKSAGEERIHGGSYSRRIAAATQWMTPRLVLTQTSDVTPSNLQGSSSELCGRLI